MKSISVYIRLRVINEVAFFPTPSIEFNGKQMKRESSGIYHLKLPSSKKCEIYIRHKSLRRIVKHFDLLDEANAVCLNISDSRYKKKYTLLRLSSLSFFLGLILHLVNSLLHYNNQSFNYLAILFMAISLSLLGALLVLEFKTRSEDYILEKY